MAVTSLLLGCTAIPGDSTTESTLAALRSATDVVVVRSHDPVDVRDLPSPLHAELTSTIERVAWTRDGLASFDLGPGQEWVSQLSGRVATDLIAPNELYLVVITGRGDPAAADLALQLDRIGAVIELDTGQLLDTQPGGQAALDRVVAAGPNGASVEAVIVALAQDLANSRNSDLVDAIEVPG